MYIYIHVIYIQPYLGWFLSWPSASFLANWDDLPGWVRNMGCSWPQLAVFLCAHQCTNLRPDLSYSYTLGKPKNNALHGLSNFFSWLVYSIQGLLRYVQKVTSKKATTVGPSGPLATARATFVSARTWGLSLFWEGFNLTIFRMLVDSLNSGSVLARVPFTTGHIVKFNLFIFFFETGHPYTGCLLIRVNLG